MKILPLAASLALAGCGGGAAGDNEAALERAADPGALEAELLRNAADPGNAQSAPSAKPRAN